jgi:plastocyanin
MSQSRFTFPTSPAPLLSGAVACLLLAPVCARAADHIVYLSDGSFDPKSLTIAVGDTVTFKSFGNTSPHNVHADDDSFRCSSHCRGDGSGANGDPARDWSATVAFNAPGVVGYRCDPHYQYGMVGSITVQAASAQNITAGLSGNWSDPSPNQGGHGLQIEVLPNNGILAIWFVFNPDGNGQAWIYTQGSYDPGSNTVAIPAYLESGGAFPPDFDASKLTVTPWGTLTLTFASCSSGTLAFAASNAAKAAGYGDVTFPIRRVTSISSLACP